MIDYIRNVVCLLIAFCLGVVLMSYILEPKSKSVAEEAALTGFYNNYRKVSDAICNAKNTLGSYSAFTKECTFPLPAREFSISVVTPEDFEVRRKTEKAAYDALAWSHPYTDPCKIVVKAGAMITFRPDEGRARWAYAGMGTGYEFGDILAHEMLHCVMESWHPSIEQMTLIAAANDRVSARNYRELGKDFHVPILRLRLWEHINPEAYNRIYDWGRPDIVLIRK